MKKYKVKITSMLLYAIALFLSNYAAYFVASMLVGLIQPMSDKIPYALLIIFAFAIYILIGFLLPLLSIFLLFKYTVEKQYASSEEDALWIKSCARLVLPAETVRFLACQLTLGQINTTGAFAFLPSLLFESTYLRFVGRSEQIRQNFLEYNFADFAIYALCFLVYLAIHLAIVVFIYKHFWFRAQRDRDDLIVYD